MYESTTQLVILTIIMIIIIVIVVLVYIFRWQIFGPKDLSVYGQLTAPGISNCIVPNTSVQDVRCTDTGTQVEISYCKPNPTTGYFCFNGREQVINSEVKLIECVPTCTSNLWDVPIPTPCLTTLSTTSTSTTLIDPLVNWCNTPGSINARFYTYECNPHDGSGPNACTFTCGQGVDNADCIQQGNTFPSNSVTITYSPTNAILENNDPPPQQLVNNNGTWTYTPISSANSEFPTIPSRQMVTLQPCSDLRGVTCGNWVNLVPPLDNIVTSNCTLFSGLPNEIRTLYDPGFFLTDMTCSAERCLPNSGNCIPEDDIEAIVPNLEPVDLPDTCGVASYNEFGYITGIVIPQKDISICVYANPNFSLTWVERPRFYYNDPTDVYNQFKGIISLPLFMSSASGYLSLYNTPCPEFIATNTNGFITYDFLADTNGFIDDKINTPPPSGIPFRFDCKGNTLVDLQITPCAWVPSSTFPPSSVWGLPSVCDTPTGLINPVVEQSALILFIKPISAVGNELLCNIIGIDSDNYVGWLTNSGSQYVPGYTWGFGETITPPLTNKIILMWNQGRFDPFTTPFLPGTKLPDLAASANFIISVNSASTPTNPLYNLSTSNRVPISTIGINNTGSNSVLLSGFSFTAVTYNGISIATSTSPTQVEINGDLMSELLYARSNRGNNPISTPPCNLLITGPD